MGRRAQAKRVSTGTQPENYFHAAFLTPPQTVQLQYAYAIDAASLSAPAFLSNPSGQQGESILQVNTTTIDITLVDDATGDDEIQYSGTTPGIMTPQVRQYD